MSYVEVPPNFYQMNEPGTPWHAGSPGWTKAPWVTWGGNPNQAGAPRQGVGCAPCGMGQEEELSPQRKTFFGVAALAIVAAGAFWAIDRAANKRQRRNYRSNRRWSTAYKDRLPNSAFLWVSADGKQRKLPVKNQHGNVDAAHVRNALARLSQADIPSSQKPKIRRKAERMLARADAR